MLDEAVALHNGEVGDPVTPEDLKAWGIDPAELSDDPEPLPEFMR